MLMNVKIECLGLGKNRVYLRSDVGTVLSLANSRKYEQRRDL
jgi:hypothetical protein